MRLSQRLSIRARLAFAFAIALLTVLALVAAFVYARVDTELTEAGDETLRSQLDSLQALILQSPQGTVPELAVAPSVDSEDNFSQILGPDGELLASTLPASSGAALDGATAAAATRGSVTVEPVEIRGVDGDAGVLAAPAAAPGVDLVLVAGSSTQDREETLSSVLAAFAVGAPLALILATAIGYLLARRALRPVEAMRARAEGISGEADGERLPLPAADDELRALALTLNSMLARLEQALERERGFVADASHELRTPLAILKAELELAQRKGRSPEQLREAITSAGAEADRLARLADDLLIVARADRGEIPIRRETVEVGPLLERLVERHRGSAAGAGRRVESRAGDGLEAAIDPLRAEQAIGNLLDNALRHGLGTVIVSAQLLDGELVVEVRDQGAGFPADFRPHAFERFSRADAGRGGGGGGLGLAIVAAVAEANGGEATLLPAEPGSGAVVRINFGAAGGGGRRRPSPQPARL